MENKQTEVITDNPFLDYLYWRTELLKCRDTINKYRTQTKGNKYFVPEKLQIAKVSRSEYIEAKEKEKTLFDFRKIIDKDSFDNKFKYVNKDTLLVDTWCSIKLINLS